MERSAITVDFETADKNDRWTYGPGFIRLAGLGVDHEEIVSTADIRSVVEVLGAAGGIRGHNVLGFDLVALAHEFPDRVDVLDWAYDKRLTDTLVLARLADPPMSLKKGPSQRYDLDAVGERVLGVGKDGDVAEMASRHGGYDRIPLDDPEYNRYVRRDVEVSARLADTLPADTDYARREMLIAAIAGHITLRGFRVDTDLLPLRIAEDRERKADLMARLAAEFGVVSHDVKGRAAKTLNTKTGRVSLAKAFKRLGVTKRPPMTPSGLYATGREAMEFMSERWAHLDGIEEMCRLVTDATERTFAESLAKNVHDGVAHPSINVGLSTGRWSSSGPNLLGVGKRGEKLRERGLFLASPGNVLLTIDLAQIDARAVAALAGDDAYLDLFAPGADSHAMIAEMVFGDPGMRNDGKPLHHSFNYGASPERLAKIAKKPLSVAEKFSNEMHRLFPDVTKWRDGVREQAASGALLDNGFGRLMRPDPERAWTQGPALMGQGCARDLMMEGILNIGRKDREVLRMLCAVVHDEVVLDVPAKDAEEIERLVVDALSFHWVAPGRSRGVDVVAEKSKRYSERWNECYG